MVSQRDDYTQVVLRTKPVLYVPIQAQGNSSGLIELVRQVRAAIFGGATEYRSGPFPGAYARDFNGSTADLVLTTDASYHPGNTFSMGGWVRRDGSNTNGHIFLHLGTGDVVFWINTANQLSIRRAGTGDIFNSTATYTNTEWMHVIAVKNAGTSAAIYVNGVSIAGTFTNQTVVAAASNPTIGTIPGGGANWLDGGVAHMAVWNRVLTQGEITTLYRAGKDAT